MELTLKEGERSRVRTRVASYARRVLAQQEAAVIIPFVLLFALFYARNDAMANPLTISSILRTASSATGEMAPPLPLGSTVPDLASLLENKQLVMTVFASMRLMAPPWSTAEL